MFDCKNTELKVGQIVKISGAYFENDNGLYYVEKVPGCPGWTGLDCCLKRVCKNGKISTAKYNICFWPISVYVNDPFKRAAANEHNKQHAQIEIIYNIDNSFIKAEFENNCKLAIENANYYGLRWGQEHPTTKQYEELAAFYAGVVAELSAPAVPVEAAPAAPVESVIDTEIEAQIAKCKKQRLTIKLQGLKGEFEAVTAAELKPGNVIIYNYGFRYTVLSIDKETNKTITFSECSNESGKVYVRRANKTRAFAIDRKATPTHPEAPTPAQEAQEAPASVETVNSTEKATTAAVEPEKQPTPAANSAPTYYSINENTAKTANDINSFREYKPGSATAGYKAVIDELWAVVQQIEQTKPENAARAHILFERFNKRYSAYLNDYYRNEAACPSVMICGPANFPTRKKEKQNSRRESLMVEYNKLNDIKRDIKHLLHYEAPILAGDVDAIERIKAKIETLESEKELMKQLNAYYRKYKSVEGFPEDIPEKLKKHINFMIIQGYAEYMGLFDTSNTNQEINRLKGRLTSLERVKSEETEPETVTDANGNKLFEVVQNKELMRLQLFFEGAPDIETRNILKSNGFKWAPSQKAWQRQLTSNALYSLKRVKEALSA